MSDTTTIRVSRKIYLTIKSLAETQNENMQEVIEEAINEFKKKKFFEEMNEAFMKTRLQKDNESDKELSDWDAAISDGLEDETWE